VLEFRYSPRLGSGFADQCHHLPERVHTGEGAGNGGVTPDLAAIGMLYAPDVTSCCLPTINRADGINHV